MTRAGASCPSPHCLRPTPGCTPTKLTPTPTPTPTLTLISTLFLILTLTLALTRYAYEVLDARPGTLLIGDEGAFGEGENYYNGAVVLLVKVCGCHPSIFGVILNRLATHTMAEEFCPRRSLLGQIASPKLHPNPHPKPNTNSNPLPCAAPPITSPSPTTPCTSVGPLARTGACSRRRLGLGLTNPNPSPNPNPNA